MNATGKNRSDDNRSCFCFQAELKALAVVVVIFVRFGLFILSAAITGKRHVPAVAAVLDAQHFGNHL